MMTLSTFAPTARFTAAISSRTKSYSPFFSRPILITISTSAAPFSMAVRASNTLVAVSVAPRGKPTTVHTGTAPCRYSTACFTYPGLMQIEAVWCALASSQIV